MHSQILPSASGNIVERFTSPRAARRLLSGLAVLISAVCLSSAASAQSGGAYKVTNLISDGSVPAAVTDPNFINPWAISSSSTWWISTQGSGMNFVVASAGTISFRVVVPAASGLATATGLPSGSVTTGGSPATALILPNGTKASFLFSTLDGTISGWNSKLGTAGAIAQIVINNSAAGASYTGLALLNNPAASYILAPNFGQNKLEIYDSTFKPATLTGTFTDPSLPAGYAPYAIHIIGTQVFVTYAVRTAAAPFRTVNAPGNGIVSIFDINGNFVSRAVTGGNLNSPWGVAIAPANFGIFSKDLLIGNFGDGLINVYDPKTFAFLGQLTDGTGKPLANASLWELLPGGTTVTGTTAVSGGDTSTVYFTAGLAGETHGLFAGIANDSTTVGTPAFGFSSSSPVATVAAGSSVQTTLAVAPTYSFSGTVTLACIGLPAGSTCTFAPAQLTVSPTASATGVLTIATSTAMGAIRPNILGGRDPGAIAAVLLLPFASFLALRRRKRFAPSLRLLGVALALFASAGFLTSCSDQGTMTPATPAGQSMVIVTATSGATSQQTTITLNVQ